MYLIVEHKVSLWSPAKIEGDGEKFDSLVSPKSIISKPSEKKEPLPEVKREKKRKLYFMIVVSTTVLCWQLRRRKMKGILQSGDIVSPVSTSLSSDLDPMDFRSGSIM